MNFLCVTIRGSLGEKTEFVSGKFSGSLGDKQC